MLDSIVGHLATLQYPWSNMTSMIRGSGKEHFHINSRSSFGNAPKKWKTSNFSSSSKSWRASCKTTLALEADVFAAMSISGSDICHSWRFSELDTRDTPREHQISPLSKETLAWSSDTPTNTSSSGMYCVQGGFSVARMNRKIGGRI